MEIELIILTMSSKNGGYCVAGVGRRTGKWIRLVSDNKETDGALAKKDIAYGNGYCCKPLDIVRVGIIGDRPTARQPENILIDRMYMWKKIGSLSQKYFLENYLPEGHDYLFGNTSGSLSYSEASQLKCSLLMVKVTNLITYQNENNKTKATFRHNGNFYENISVTDPEYYDNKVLGRSAVIVMSLGNQAKYGKFYKFIAKIFLCD